MSEKDLSQWILDGMLACEHEAPYRAFEGASLSFGVLWSGQADPHQELTELFRHLDEASQLRFSKALANAIEKYPLTKDNLSLFTDLILTGLDTNPNAVLDAVLQRQLTSPPEVRRELSLTSTFLLSDASNSEGILKLAKAMLEDDQTPPVVSAQILVALCRHDPQNAAVYAQKIRPKFEMQIETLKEAPQGYARFKSDLSQHLPPDSSVYEILSIS